MIVDFKTMPDDSRIWIYQSNRDFKKMKRTKTFKSFFALNSNVF